MPFGTAVASGARKYADFTGRAGVAEFWWFMLFVSIVSFGLGALNISTPLGMLAIGTTLASVWSVVVLLPTLAVAVRRLRDGGNSWLQLLWLLVPIAGIIVLVLRLCDPARPEPGTSTIPRI